MNTTRDSLSTIHLQISQSPHWSTHLEVWVGFNVNNKKVEKVEKVVSGS